LVQSLQDQGLLRPSKRGRPPIYKSDEERREALLAQKRACNHRYEDKLRAAKASQRQAKEPEQNSPV
jgi:hypothetical protein